MIDLSGKTAFVAGGSSGINLAIAKRLGAAGARLYIVSRDLDRVNVAVSELRGSGFAAEGTHADVRDYTAVSAAVEACQASASGINIVISGAAGNFIAAADQMSPNAFRTVVDIDLIGTFHVFRATRAYLATPGASLIAISATHGSRPAIGQTHVCAAKAGIEMLVRCLAMEWGSEGIRVNTIAPGPVSDTEGMRRLTPTTEARASLEETIPLRRYARIEEIAEAAAFLASDGSAYMTGTTICVDGGQSLTGQPDYLEFMAS